VDIKLLKIQRLEVYVIPVSMMEKCFKKVIAFQLEIALIANKRSLVSNLFEI
jgi:hypothetical protein